MKRWDSLLLNCHAATQAGGEPYGAVRDAAIAMLDGRIDWVGPHGALPQGQAEQTMDLAGAWVTPGLIDCHTHLVFAGSRVAEFEQRLQGASYADIARAGGGILSTVLATREADETVLVRGAAERVRTLMADGVTSVEVKSGYGLEMDAELRMLRAARALAGHVPATIKTTCLAAHVVPLEYAGRADAYTDLVCERIIPAVAEQGLADAVDAFCEHIGFSQAQVARVFEAAAKVGLAVKLHADQLSDTGGAALAARYGALSADHLEYTSVAGVEAMAKAGTVAVLLPGAFHVLGETRRPPVEMFRQAGVPMAVATDCNPGSSPVLSLRLMMSMACTQFGLTPAESLRGVTRNAAMALGMEAQCGSLEAGKQADLAVWNVDHPAELCYWLAGDLCRAVFRCGVLTHGAV